MSSGADEIWRLVREEALRASLDPLLGPLVRHVVLERDRLGDAVCAAVAGALATSLVPEARLGEVLIEVVGGHELDELFAADLLAIRSRDQASTGHLAPLLFSKAFHGLAGSRIAHALWQRGEGARAQYLQGRISMVSSMDIHPGAHLAGGVVIDHGTGIVIGETAVVETGVYIFHGVTLGSTGIADGDRHPKVRQDAFLGAGATILGNVEIGRGAVVAAGSVVLKDVPAGTTVAGVPARVIGDSKPILPHRSVDDQARGDADQAR